MTTERTPEPVPATRRWLFALPVLGFGALALAFAAGLGRDPAIVPSALIDQPVPAFDLPPVPGRTLGLASADLKGEVSLVNADPTQMQQVFMNLCINASHAMPDGGELIVNLANTILDEAYCRQYSYARPGDYLCLSVRDTGAGIPQEDAHKLFTKFFRGENVKKFAVDGSGLGLYITKNIIRRHGGKIWAESTPGRGSTFHFTLPTDPNLIPPKETIYEEE